MRLCVLILFAQAVFCSLDDRPKKKKRTVVRPRVLVAEHPPQVYAEIAKNLDYHSFHALSQSNSKVYHAISHLSDKIKLQTFCGQRHAALLTNPAYSPFFLTEATTPFDFDDGTFEFDYLFNLAVCQHEIVNQPPTTQSQIATSDIRFIVPGYRQFADSDIEKLMQVYSDTLHAIDKYNGFHESTIEIFMYAMAPDYYWLDKCLGMLHDYKIRNLKISSKYPRVYADIDYDEDVELIYLYIKRFAIEAPYADRIQVFQVENLICDYFITSFKSARKLHCDVTEGFKVASDFSGFDKLESFELHHFEADTFLSGEPLKHIDEIITDLHSTPAIKDSKVNLRSLRLSWDDDGEYAFGMFTRHRNTLKTLSLIFDETDSDEDPLVDFREFAENNSVLRSLFIKFGEDTRPYNFLSTRGFKNLNTLQVSDYISEGKALKSVSFTIRNANTTFLPALVDTIRKNPTISRVTFNLMLNATATNHQMGIECKKFWTTVMPLYNLGRGRSMTVNDVPKSKLGRIARDDLAICEKYSIFDL